jgi:hypothetical protein
MLRISFLWSFRDIDPLSLQGEEDSGPALLAIRGWRDIVFGISRYALYSAAWALLIESVVAVVFSYWLVEPMAYWLSGNQDVAAITKACCGLKKEYAIPYQFIFYSVAP